MKYHKYPRTRHLPWSGHVSSDDKMMTLEEIETFFQGREVVITEKMDGENTTMYNDHIHARSIDSKDHPSRAWVKQLWGNLRHELGDGERICGENLYAKHSIFYDQLPSYFLGFSFWRDDLCLKWDDTVSLFDLLNIRVVNVLYRGPFDTDKVMRLHESLDLERTEGYVVRWAGDFHYDQFTNRVAKYVRPKHVQSSEHWMYQEIIPNKVMY
jgi:ATP-dependent RNA circularization protein (DNA/RNA ligase family)